MQLTAAISDRHPSASSIVVSLCDAIFEQSQLDGFASITTLSISVIVDQQYCHCCEVEAKLDWG